VAVSPKNFGGSNAPDPKYQQFVSGLPSRPSYFSSSSFHPSPPLPRFISFFTTLYSHRRRLSENSHGARFHYPPSSLPFPSPPLPSNYNGVVRKYKPVKIFEFLDARRRRVKRILDTKFNTFMYQVSCRPSGLISRNERQTV
jgi:hypothetical protein